MAEENKDDLAFDEKVDPLYKKGFEIAYWLERGDNPLLKHIMEANANGNAYDKGLHAGQREADREKMKEHIAAIKRQHQQEKDRDRGHEIE